MSTRYYLITAAQNSTPVALPFWRNLLAYQKWLGNCELLVGRFVYNVCRPEAKVADANVRTDAVYAPQIPIQRPLRRQLAPGLVWCPEMNILPTANRPLSGLDAYGAGSSAIIPHAKLALKSIPTERHERTVFNYTTGACTLPNYIQKKAGLKAAFHHTQCALIVEVADDGRWWVRQLNADSQGTICDLTICVSKGIVTEGVAIETISWGDIHACEIDPVVRAMNWKQNAGIIDWLKPRYQFMHDLLAFRAASHWDAPHFSKRFKIWHERMTVESELRETLALMQEAHRDFCKMVVVNSNHDRHPDRWLDWADYRKDIPNAEIFLEAQLERLRATKRNEEWYFLPWAMRKLGENRAQYLGINDSFKVKGVEYGWHGDLGPNGSRGTTANLSKACTRATKGHNHTAEIIDGACSGGVCNTDMDYAVGPSTWSVSHVAQYQNRKRAIITCYGPDPWASFSG